MVKSGRRRDGKVGLSSKGKRREKKGSGRRATPIFLSTYLSTYLSILSMVAAQWWETGSGIKIGKSSSSDNSGRARTVR